ncbi:PocR ligand-binding domain-containing protein [bacterium]|nr:PocR ligand-binding domain-containing protein [bacterium]
MEQWDCRPKVECNTCGQSMITCAASLSEVLATTPDDVQAACKAAPSTAKLFRCLNPRCVAPQRAIVMERDREAELIAHVDSWLPVTTPPLAYETQEEADHCPNPGAYVVAEFARDSIRRTPDISFSASVDVNLLRRALDGFGREIRGPLTIFDFCCWHDAKKKLRTLLQPIEALDRGDRPVPPRYNPFCVAVRRCIHRRAMRRFRSELGAGPCHYMAEDPDPAAQEESPRPRCYACTARETLKQSSGGEAPMAELQHCFLYADVLERVSPCYRCDRGQVLRFLELARKDGVLKAADAWRSDPLEYTRTCWAGFQELASPIIVHNHLVAFAMSGQVVPVPQNATQEQKRACLQRVRAVAVAAAVSQLGGPSPDEKRELAAAFDLKLWTEWEILHDCCWMAGPRDLQDKIDVLVRSTDMIENEAQACYAQERRLREQCFQEELYGRFGATRELTRDTTLTFLPAILERMAQFWAFDDVLFLSLSVRTSGALTLLADRGNAYSEENLDMRVPPIEFPSEIHPLGILLTTSEKGRLDEKLGCLWEPTIRVIQKLRRWDKIRELVAYVTPTAFGCDVFVFHGRNRDRVSLKPRLTQPSALCLESIRRVCSGLSKRMADWMYFHEQVLHLHVLSHTVRTPILTASAALGNLIGDGKIVEDTSTKNLRNSIAEIGERIMLSLEVVNSLHSTREPERATHDLLAVARKLAKEHRRRYGHDWTLEASGEETWPLSIARKRLHLLLSNALSNAFKYSYKNRTVKIHISADAETGETLFRADNWGDGVPEAEVPMLQHLLYRGTAVRYKTGTGLGLFLIDLLLRCEGKTWKFTSKPSNPYVDADAGESFINSITLRLPGREGP